MKPFELANKVFEWADEFSRRVHTADAIAKKLVQIYSVTSKTCGNCYHWMKTSCKPEKVHGQFKSVNSIACGDFVREPAMVKLEEQFRRELESLTKKEMGKEPPR